MEVTLGLLALLIVFGIPGTIIGILIHLRRLGRRLKDVERRLAILTAGPADGAPVARTDTGPASPPLRTPDAILPTPPVEPAAKDSPWPAVARPEREGPGPVDRLFAWMAVNWFYVVAAASLALAGIFLVQYGAERGLLPPSVRVLSAAIFGAALIGAGEWIRRRWGDGEDVATAYLPSVLSGAAVVTLFAAILGARHLYDLIGQGTALIGMAFVAMGAVVLGWFHGPVLVAVGLIGGAVAPFVVGGDRGSDLWPLHGYFLILTLGGLAVDAVRRWQGRWVSILALTLGFGASALLVTGAPETTLAHLLACAAMALAALALPIGRSVPDHEAPTVTEAVIRRRPPPVTTLIAFGAVAVASALAVLGTSDSFWPAVAVLALLFGAVALWAAPAEGVQDAAVLPVVGLIASVALWPAPPGDAAVTLVLMVGAAMSAAALLRSLRTAATLRLGWSLGTVLIAPATGLALHLSWQAPFLVGAYAWSLHALAVATGLTLAAGVWAARDGEDRLRPSLAALVAFTLIAYALAQIAGEAALTAAVATMAALAVWMARRFRLPLLDWFVILAAPFTVWRLTAEPGIAWHVDGPLPPALLSLGTSVAGFALAWMWLRGRGAATPVAVAETAALSAGGYALTVLLWRGLRAAGWETGHLNLGLTATIWLSLMWAQLELRHRGGGLPWLRSALAALFALFAALALAGAVFLGPLFNDSTSFFRSFVQGWPIVNSLIPAYLLPAAILLAAGWQQRRVHGPGQPGRNLTIAGTALGAFWAVLAIRHFWRGAGEMVWWYGISDPELTSYTVALLILGGVLFYQGVAKRSDTWRRAGTAVLALTMLKVFLIDVWSLGGLMRVGALFALAAALLGLAWLYRWASGAGASGAVPSAGPD
ncbi:DUF2339 domain-containing protein [Jannaschia rubra]|uniref:Putative membrane protein n=1 Tax=Jannaschia rubra TaxID=282197 RepID=A0A0M6XU00_9RHOB|nr:DUF2339 domain-containing protein [Jannaschia rubra]CTQ33753.1 putative membrane protein [Jannaschia rubra]SFG08171.1 Uncharacterized membrane protein [Jannaschia rubra]